ncbi:hypothetical protein [Novosphingobium sp. 9U]|uniref:hypothetical protein n=1 Tax=Novosphingobium sp. 9U TaxID=2653158 RepID=UPI0012F2EEC6|nr:hypothetical protein [Novosphingobium sp. 9U]VWX53234.1 hypothetical protein NOVOSPHI9U_420477 [Novosphingobium sp. 9U]
MTLTGGRFDFDLIDLAGNLTVASGTSLAASRVGFGVADSSLAIAGEFTGSVQGGAGRNTIEVSGNAVFASISNVEALRMSAGLATVTGAASLNTIALNGGRFVGLVGRRSPRPRSRWRKGRFLDLPAR